jgi:outer membrane protein OmpA-like peptidoglycan-associated protein
MLSWTTMNVWHLSGRRQRVTAAWLAVAVVAGLLAPGYPAMAASAVANAQPSAASRELDRVQALLLLRLASLPDDNRTLILREPDSLTLRIPARLLFESDTAVLKPSDAAPAGPAAPLAAAGQVLKKYRKLQARIVAYTDSLGDVTVNQNLSEQRAQAVCDALAAQGIAAVRLQQQGAGAADPVAGNATPEGRVENRRVEIEFARAAPARGRAPGELRSAPAAAP